MSNPVSNNADLRGSVDFIESLRKALSGESSVAAKSTSDSMKHCCCSMPEPELSDEMEGMIVAILEQAVQLVQNLIGILVGKSSGTSSNGSLMEKIMGGGKEEEPNIFDSIIDGASDLFGDFLGGDDESDGIGGIVSQGAKFVGGLF